MDTHSPAVQLQLTKGKRIMAEDFPTSPSKRRRTMSPEEQQSTEHAAPPATLPASTAAFSQATVLPGQDEVLAQKPGEEEASGTGSFLDVLMEQVEAESAPAGVLDTTAEPAIVKEPLQEPNPTVRTPEPPIQEVERETQPFHQQEDGQNAKSMVPGPEVAPTINDDVGVVEDVKRQPQVPLADDTASIFELPVENAADSSEQPAVSSDLVQAATAMEGIVQESAESQPPNEIGAPPGTQPEAREWETDSSPYDSSDSDSSTSTDSDGSDEDPDVEYSMLDPEEQARILMQDDGGSDDEGGKGKEKGNATMRTANERQEEVIPKPNIEITDEMQIEILGIVEGIVESTVVVKAKTTGEYQVLESGSLLCLEDRSVVGVVAEPMGRVEQPMYTIRFTNDAAIEEAGLSSHGTTVYYVVPHSTFVFTQPLKGLKGSDASNFHDEEVGDEEMEFSDDEKEAEHKRLLKMKRQGRLDRTDGGRGGRGGRGRGRGRGDFRESNLRHSSVSSTTEPIPDEPSNGALNYDDGPDNEYTPLRRPSQDQQPSVVQPRTNDRGTHSQNRGRGGVHGDRGGRGNRGARGGRGSYDNYNRQNYQQNQQHPQMLPPPLPSLNSQPQQYFSQAQQTPQLTPQVPFSPFWPSPISPLPGQQFNFAQFPNFPPPPPLPLGYGQQQYNQPSQQNGQNWGGWQPPNLNQAAAAQVQRQLQELMRAQQQGQQNGYSQGQGRP